MRIFFALLLTFHLAFAEEKFVIGNVASEGLFSSFLTVISSLIWAEKNHKTPVVYWNQDCCYASAEGYNGASNPWEYYFKPVSSLSYQNGDPIHTSLYAPDGMNLYMVFCRQREDFYRAKG
jgi:hypothetical protein